LIQVIFKRISVYKNNWAHICSLTGFLAIRITFLIMTKTNSAADEDLHLSVAIKQGDKQALGRVYDKYAPVLMGLITRIIPTDSSAEEILQTTFLHTWHQIGSFDATRSSLFSWLMNTARQLAIDNVRSGAVQNLTLHIIVDEHATGSNTKQINPEPVQKIIFDMVYYKGESCIKAAGALGIPVEEIKKHIRLAIKNMISGKEL
jgi:RNA polymerase sigma-70 factor (ECF subfamily)